MKKELSYLIVAVSVWTAGVVIAPLMHGSMTAELLYRAYSVVCHQFQSRSFSLNGHPFGVCIRCTAIYSGFLAALITVRFWPWLRNVEWDARVLIAVTAVPMAWDGMASLLGIAEATTASRMITGSLFGTGLALMLHHVLCEFIQLFTRGSFKHYEPKT
jgi:uncharacterized membrane protein